MDYDGVLYVRIHRAEGLLPQRNLLLGSPDPIIQVQVANERVTVPCCHSTELHVRPIWNEIVEINCRSIENQTLGITVEERFEWAFARTDRILAQVAVPLKALLLETHQNQTTIPLHPHGSITLELTYASFVDRWKIN